MKKEEIRKILDNTKVYVNGKSKEIQEKLFSFGYGWNNSNPTKVSDVNEPFLFIYKKRYITNANDMCLFTTHQNREITAEEILALEVTEPSYRPFNTKEECWNEMQKHQPFGWLKSKETGCYIYVSKVAKSVATNHVLIMLVGITISQNTAAGVFDGYTFTDGTPFGIKED